MNILIIYLGLLQVGISLPVWVLLMGVIEVAVEILLIKIDRAKKEKH